jgi:hypothetical protein
MKISKYETQAEAQQATVEYFMERNAARGQYPKRINVERKLRNIGETGLTFTYTYKGETVEHFYGAYQAVVTFDAPAGQYGVGN